jgi:hypothetical protein
MLVDPEPVPPRFHLLGIICFFQLTKRHGLNMPECRGLTQPSLQDVEKRPIFTGPPWRARTRFPMLCSRLANILDVPMGEEPVSAGSGLGG